METPKDDLVPTTIIQPHGFLVVSVNWGSFERPAIWGPYSVPPILGNSLVARRPCKLITRWSHQIHHGSEEFLGDFAGNVRAPLV